MSVQGSEVVVGGSDHGLKVFDSTSGRLVRTLYSKRYGHSEWVTCVQHLPDGRILSAGSCRGPQSLLSHSCVAGPHPRPLPQPWTTSSVSGRKGSSAAATSRATGAASGTAHCASLGLLTRLRPRKNVCLRPPRERRGHVRRQRLLRQDPPRLVHSRRRVWGRLPPRAQGACAQAGYRRRRRPRQRGPVRPGHAVGEEHCTAPPPSPPPACAVGLRLRPHRLSLLPHPLSCPLSGSAHGPAGQGVGGSPRPHHRGGAAAGRRRERGDALHDGGPGRRSQGVGPPVPPASGQRHQPRWRRQRRPGHASGGRNGGRNGRTARGQRRRRQGSQRACLPPCPSLRGA